MSGLSRKHIQYGSIWGVGKIPGALWLFGSLPFHCEIDHLDICESFIHSPRCNYLVPIIIVLRLSNGTGDVLRLSLNTYRADASSY